MEAFYKLSYDIGCYYAFVTFFLSYSAGYQTRPYSFMVFFVACLLAAHAEKWKRWEKVATVAAFVLPAICFLWEKSVWGRVILILPWLYMVLTVIRQGYDISYQRFRKTYLIFFWIFAGVFGFFVAENPLKGEIAMITAIPYVVIFLAAGIMLLQMLRFQSGSKDKKRLEKYQRTQLGIFVAVSTVLSVSNVMDWLYIHVFHPLSQLLFAAVIGVLAILLEPLSEHRTGVNTAGILEDLREFGQLAQKNMDEYEEEFLPIKQMMQAMRGEQPQEMDWTYAIIGFGVLFAIVILAVLVGGKKIKRKSPAIEDEREEFYEEIPEAEVLKKHSPRPDIVIRYYYREFMKKTESKKNKLECSDTTKDILGKFIKQKKAQEEEQAKADELTQIYRRARYDNNEVSHADANKMKSLVKGMKL